MFSRAKENPILKPSPNSWENKKTYNPAVEFHKNKFYLFYRAVGSDNKSRIGLALSADGVNFTRKSKPLITPRYSYEKRGVEDPRIVKVENKFFMTYTAYDGKTARLALASSSNLLVWKKLGLMLPNWNFLLNHNFIAPWDKALNSKKEDKNWSKAGAIFPEKINNKYWMLFGDRNIWVATSENAVKWSPINQPFLKPRKKNNFDNAHIEMGGPPIKTKKGWLVFYHGVNKEVKYSLGAVLLDLKNPKKILQRSNNPIFTAEKPYEKIDKIDIAQEKKYHPDVIFTCDSVVKDDIIYLYYGASDRYVCLAKGKLSQLLKNIFN